MNIRVFCKDCDDDLHVKLVINDSTPDEICLEVEACTTCCFDAYDEGIKQGKYDAKDGP